MAILFDAASAAFGSPHDVGSDSGSVNHTVGAGRERFLVVGIGGQDDGKSVTDVTYGGVALTLLRRQVDVDGLGAWTEIWYLIAPNVGLGLVAVTLTAATEWGAGAHSWFGVDNDTPWVGTGEGSASTAGASFTYNVTSAAGHVVVGHITQHADVGAGPAINLAPGAGQTQMYEDDTGDFSNAAAVLGDWEIGAAVVTMSYTSNTNNAVWAGVFGSLRPASEYESRPIEYTLDTWDPEQRIFDANGHMVPRHKIKPNNWCRIVGLESTTAEVYASNYEDPTLVYFESVSYDGETDEVQIVTNRGDLPEVIMARLATGSTG